MTAYVVMVTKYNRFGKPESHPEPIGVFSDYDEAKALMTQWDDWNKTWKFWITAVKHHG